MDEWGHHKQVPAGKNYVAHFQLAEIKFYIFHFHPLWRFSISTNSRLMPIKPHRMMVTMFGVLYNKRQELFIDDEQEKGLLQTPQKERHIRIIRQYPKSSLLLLTNFLLVLAVTLLIVLLRYKDTNLDIICSIYTEQYGQCCSLNLY